MTHKGCVLQRSSFDTLSDDVTVVLMMRQSIVQQTLHLKVSLHIIPETCLYQLFRVEDWHTQIGYTCIINRHKYMWTLPTHHTLLKLIYILVLKSVKYSQYRIRLSRLHIITMIGFSGEWSSGFVNKYNMVNSDCTFFSCFCWYLCTIPFI